MTKKVAKATPLPKFSPFSDISANRKIVHIPPWSFGLERPTRQSLHHNFYVNSRFWVFCHHISKQYSAPRSTKHLKNYLWNLFLAAPPARQKDSIGLIFWSGPGLFGEAQLLSRYCSNCCPDLHHQLQHQSSWCELVKSTRINLTGPTNAHQSAYFSSLASS